MWNETAQADEIESAEAAWVAEDEYNTVKTLSPLQSRLESLNTKGIQVDLASKMETSAIVARVKEYEKEKRAKAEAEAAAKQLESIELAQKEKEQAAAGAAVEKKRRQSKDAAKFLRKMSSK